VNSLTAALTSTNSNCKLQTIQIRPPVTLSFNLLTRPWSWSYHAIDPRTTCANLQQDRFILLSTKTVTISPKVHNITASTRCEKEKTSDGAWMLLSTTAWVSVLSVGDSMHEVWRQRMYGRQFAARFLAGRGRRCWRRAVKSVMECWWPAWAGWWCSPAPD